LFDYGKKFCLDFDWNSEVTQSGISFQLYDRTCVTILASTKHTTNDSSRYRIQSDCLASIYLIFRDFLHRLSRKLGTKENLAVELIDVDNELPFLAEYFGEIDAHTLRRRRDVQIKV